MASHVVTTNWRLKLVSVSTVRLVGFMVAGVINKGRSEELPCPFRSNVTTLQGYILDRRASLQMGLGDLKEQPDVFDLVNKQTCKR